MKTKTNFGSIRAWMHMLILTLLVFLTGCIQDEFISSPEIEESATIDLQQDVAHDAYSKHQITFDEFKSKLQSLDQNGGIDGRSPSDLSFLFETNYIVEIDKSRIVEFVGEEVTTYTFNVTTADQDFTSFTNLVYVQKDGKFSYHLVRYKPNKEWLISRHQNEFLPYEGETTFIDKSGEIIGTDNNGKGCVITAVPIIQECYGSACPCTDGNGIVIGWQFNISCGGMEGNGSGGSGGSGGGTGNGNGGGNGGGNGNNLPTDPVEWSVHMFLHNISSQEDYFYLDENLNVHPNFQFATLPEVENYLLNDNTLQSLAPLEAQDGTIVTEFKYTKSFGRTIRILVKQTLCNNGTGQSYQMHQITANLAGSQNFGATWQTNMINYNVENNLVIINVYGTLGFAASAMGIPFAYFDNKHFRMKIDIFSGNPVDFIELD